MTSRTSARAKIARAMQRGIALSVSRHQVFLTARNMVASRRQLLCRDRAHACRATRFALIRLLLDALAILAMKCCHQLLLLDSLRQGPRFPRRPLDQIVSSVQPGIVPAPCTRIACITFSEMSSCARMPPRQSCFRDTLAIIPVDPTVILVYDRNDPRAARRDISAIVT